MNPKRIFLGALALSVLAAASAIGWFYLYGAAAMTRASFWADDIAEFEAADAERFPDPGLIVFTGSSSIRLWDTLEADMAPLRVLNRGFGGAHMDHVVHYADRIVTPYAPRALVVYVGDNDIGYGKTPEVVEADFRALVEKARAAQPTLPIYYLTIKASRLRWELWPTMDEANDRIAAFAKTDPALHVIDVSAPMVALGRGDAPPEDLFIFDGLHLSAEGYALWTGIVRARLLRDLGAG